MSSVWARRPAPNKFMVLELCPGEDSNKVTVRRAVDYLRDKDTEWLFFSTVRVSGSRVGTSCHGTRRLLFANAAAARATKKLIRKTYDHNAGPSPGKSMVSSRVPKMKVTMQK